MAKYEPEVLQGIYQRVVGAMSGIAEVTVEVKPGTQPHFQPKGNIIRMPDVITYADNNEDDFTMGRGTCVHEAAHLVFMPDTEPIEKAIEIKGFCSKDFREWMNVFGDINNESKAIEVWPHFKQPLQDKSMKYVKKYPKVLESDNPFIQVLVRCDPLITAAAKFPEGYNPELKKFVNSAVKSFKKNNIGLATGTELLKFTENLFYKWAKLRDDKNRGVNLNALEELKKALGKAIVLDDDELQDEINKKIDQANNSWFENEIDRNLIRVATGAGKLSDKSIEELKKLINKKNGKTKSHGNGYLAPLTNVHVGIIERIKVVGDDTIDIIDITRLYKEGKQVNKSLKKKIKLEHSFEQRHRSGDIDMDEVRRQVAKTGMIYTPTVFQRRNKFQRGGEWALSVLVDCSGSMHGHRMTQAKQALTTLAYALNGLPNVHYEMVGYDYDEANMEYVVKEYKEKRTKINRIKALRAGGGTPTHIIMESALRRIVKFRSMKKVMIVITDGIGNATLTNESSKKAKRYNVEVLGLGICIDEDQMTKQFPHHMVFEVSDDMDKQLTTAILNTLGQKDSVKLVKNLYKY